MNVDLESALLWETIPGTILRLDECWNDSCVASQKVVLALLANRTTTNSMPKAFIYSCLGKEERHSLHEINIFHFDIVDSRPVEVVL